MKKIGIVLAALVIATFMVGTVAAMQEINKPPQEQYFTEKSCVQGTGLIEIEKVIIDKEIAIEVHEFIVGDTGPDGSFAMVSTEKLNESANISDMTDPNYLHKKMIQFNGDMLPTSRLLGVESYASPSFHGGTGAMVIEHFDVSRLQKDETTTVKTTSKYLPAAPYMRQSLNFNTMTDFSGEWGTDSAWKKCCKKDISHHQLFIGDFQAQKNLIFEEDVTEQCLGKGDC